jgi:phosphoserine phosphatase
VPGPLAEPVTVTVGHFAPVQIPVTALAGFATAALDLPRLPGVEGVSPEEWDAAVVEAAATVADLEAVEARRVAPENAIALGDGANDLDMIKAAGIGVAYHAKPVVAAEANASIRHTDLTAALYFQTYLAEDIAFEESA